MTDSQNAVDESFMLLGGQRVSSPSVTTNKRCFYIYGLSQIREMHSINFGI